MSKQFAVISEDGRVELCETARDTALFVWGKDLRHWMIYELVTDPPSEIGLLEKFLDSGKARMEGRAS